MRRLFYALIGIVLVVGIANAGWNLRQKSDGSTVWTNEDSVDVPVGDSGLTVSISDLSTAGSWYVVSHKAGKIKKIYAVAYSALSWSPAVLSFHVSPFSDGASAQPSTAGGPHPISTGATISLPASVGAGNVVSVSPALDDPPKDSSVVDVGQGDLLIVHTDGGPKDAARGTVTFIIE